MKQATALLALAASANALVSRGDTCCFSLTAKSAGSLGGKVGQLSDGQNRINQARLPAGSYCIDSHGGLTDGQGRGCILTPPTTQWQCDSGAKSTLGFSVGCGGQLTYQNSTAFWSCPTGNNGGYNIYSKKLSGQDGCQQVWLSADGCKRGCPARPSRPPPPAPAPPASKCPMDLNRAFEFPHLILPVDGSNPNVAYGTSYNGTASGSVSSIFNFDIPNSAAGKTCKVVFLFPKQTQLETSAYTYSGNGGVNFQLLSGPVVQGKTTFANAPKAKQDYGVTVVAPGNAYTIASMSCPAGKAVAFWMKPQRDTCLNYFQDSNPCPIGLYMTVA